VILLLSPIAIVGAIAVAAFTVLVVLVERRRSQQASLLWLLAIAVDNDLPLADELESYSDAASRRQRHDVLYVAELLRSGESLPDALAAVPGLIPRDTLLAAHMGLESGRLAEALRGSAIRHQQQRPFSQSPTASLLGSIVYCGAVLGSVLFLTFFVMYFIIPKFRKIFEDFDTDLPALTTRVIDVSDVMVEYFYLVVLGGLGAATLLVLIGWATVRGWSELRLEWLGPALTRIDAPAVLRNLALVTASGLPIETGLATIAREHHRANIRRRAATALAESKSGSDPWHALAHAGLATSAEAELLSSAQAAGNVSWALNEIAHSIEQRRWFRWTAFVEAVSPVPIIALGAVVLVICASFFLPLVKLINDLS
jgi:type II secretory pathway component PulF